MTWQNLKYVALRWTFFEICGIDDVALFRIYNIHRFGFDFGICETRFDRPIDYAQF